MYEIRDWLLIGKFAETRHQALLNGKKITAMLQLAELVEHPNIETLYVPVEDGRPLEHELITQGVEFIRQQKAEGKRVLVACGAGISRSTTFVMAYLMEEEGLDLFDAFGAILPHHPNADPHPELAKSLLAYHGIEIDMLELFDRLFEVRRDVLRGTQDNP